MIRKTKLRVLWDYHLLKLSLHHIEGRIYLQVGSVANREKLGIVDKLK